MAVGLLAISAVLAANPASGAQTFTSAVECVPGPGNAVVESQPPANLHQDGLPAVSGQPTFESDACIFLFAEQQDVIISQSINPAKPKTTNILDTTGTPETRLIRPGRSSTAISCTPTSRASTRRRSPP